MRNRIVYCVSTGIGLEKLQGLYRECAAAEKVLIDVKGLYTIDELKELGLLWWRL